MTVIIDYGVGNLFSLKSSFASLGENVTVSSDRDTILNADRIILPGVGAFEDAAKKLRMSGLDSLIKEAVKNGTPLLGICLGMQMLFEKSYEFGEHEGLGLIPGRVEPFAEKVKPLKVPQIGWNRLTFPNGKEKGVKIVPLGIHLYTDNYIKSAEDTYQLVGDPVEEILVHLMPLFILALLMLNIDHYPVRETPGEETLQVAKTPEMTNLPAIRLQP